MRLFCFRLILAVYVLAVCSQSLFAQTRENKVITGIEATFFDYKGVLSKQLFTPSNFNPGLRLSANIYLNRLLNASVTSSFVPKASYPQGFGGFSPQLLMDFNAGLQLKGNNGWIMNEEARFSPYIYSGIGFNTTEGINKFYLPVAAGLRVRLSNTLALNLESMYRQSFDDGIQPRSHTIGFFFLLPTNKPKPAKVQPLADKNNAKAPVKSHSDDEKPVIVAKNKIEPLPKTNKQVEETDAQPTPIIRKTQPVAEPPVVASAKEVVDSDGDGIEDDKDGCPADYGSVQDGGCPEHLKIKTKPTTKPKATPLVPQKDPVLYAENTNSRRDTDGDGIWDSVDGCPLDYGKVEDGGCPERYRVGKAVDKVIDRKDDIMTAKVPQEKPMPNTTDKRSIGSPLAPNPSASLSMNDLERLDVIAKQIKFFPGTDSIMSQSLPYIAELSAILERNPNLKLQVHGYYGFAKNEDSNKVLSVSRAHKVKSLLLIDHDQRYMRVSTNGFGSLNTAGVKDKAYLELKLVPLK